MESPAHCTTAGGELEHNSGDLIDFSTEVLEHNSGDLIDIFTELSTCYDQPACLEFPPTLPLLPMLTSVWSPLSPDSPSAHPQSSTCAVGSQRVCQFPSVSGLEDPSSPPPASESRTPPRPFDPAAPPRLSAHSSPSSPVGPPAPPGSLVFPAPPWSVGVALDLRLSVSASGSSASGPASVGWPPGVVSPSSTMAPPSVGSTVGHHHGCGLGLPLLLLLRVPPVSSLAPPTFVTPLDNVVFT
ncbi:Levansucrase [Labeo rohita]|uniref:Levansucrase n=1 Tax=Labeo rohita TaxID=84645 RepID=A0ABQ8KZ52_LABRO|nr:Levansucrase [Labeo rohita]